MYIKLFRHFCKLVYKFAIIHTPGRIITRIHDNLSGRIVF